MKTERVFGKRQGKGKGKKLDYVVECRISGLSKPWSITVEDPKNDFSWEYRIDASERMGREEFDMLFSLHKEMLWPKNKRALVRVTTCLEKGKADRKVKFVGIVERGVLVEFRQDGLWEGW